MQKMQKKENKDRRMYTCKITQEKQPLPYNILEWGIPQGIHPKI